MRKANGRGIVRRKKTAEVEVLEPVEDELYKNVRSIIVKARAKVYVAANTALVKSYWDVGREIVEKQGGEARSRYGDGLVARLSLKLTAEFGPGYNKVNLFYMRRFFLAFPKVHTLCKQLNWSHYRTLIAVEDPKARGGSILRSAPSPAGVSVTSSGRFRRISTSGWCVTTLICGRRPRS